MGKARFSLHVGGGSTRAVEVALHGGGGVTRRFAANRKWDGCCKSLGGGGFRCWNAGNREGGYCRTGRGAVD